MLVGPCRAADMSRQALWVMEPAFGNPDISLEQHKVNKRQPQERLEPLFLNLSDENSRVQGRLGASEIRPAMGCRGDYPGVQLQVRGQGPWALEWPWRGNASQGQRG